MKNLLNNDQLTVLLICYNHEKYLTQAIESVLMQKVDFIYCIYIMDDCSSDATLLIAEEYQQKYPEIIQIFQSNSNLGITKNYKRSFELVRTKYIAVIEGDDYWTSPNKLQIQYDFLEDHYECSMCAHSFLMQTELSNTKNINKYSFGKILNKKISFLNTENLIKYNYIGNFSTSMYRKSVVDQIPVELYNMEVYDWMFNIINSQFGLIGYINKIMSVYRQHEKGIWSKKILSEKLVISIKAIDDYDKFLDFKFHEEFTNRKNELQLNLLNEKQTLTTVQVIKNIIQIMIPCILLKYLKNIVISITPPIFLKVVKRIIMAISK